MEDPEENINHQEDKSLEIASGLEKILEIFLDIHKIDIEGYQEYPIGLETKEVIGQVIEQEVVQMILDRQQIL